DPAPAAPARDTQPHDPQAAVGEKGGHARPQRFVDLVDLAYARDIVLYGHLFSAVRPVRFEWGRFEFQPTAEAPADLAQRLDRALRDWTGQRWVISVVSAAGAATLAESQRSDRERLIAEVRATPIVQAVLDAF